MKYPLFRQFACAVAVALLSVNTYAHADVEVDGDRLTVRTENLVAHFRGPDLVRLSSRVTGESYIQTVTPLKPIADITMSPPTGTPLIFTGWRRGVQVNGIVNAAQTSLNDLTRTIWMNVVVDTETQDIVVTLWGEARRDGVTGVKWGIRGLDLSAGRLVLPALGGISADKATMPASLILRYPNEWEANLAIWEERSGGIVIYSRDDQAVPKKIVANRRGDYADLTLETEALAPWNKAGGAPHVEWRINSFRGDWRVPATGYRNLMTFLRKPIPRTGPRAWNGQIRTVVTVTAASANGSALEALAKRFIPARTLLYFPDWRVQPFGTGYPDYRPRDGMRDLVERAHTLGFRVMLHADALAVSPSSDEFARLRQYQVRDPQGGAPQGSRLARPADPKAFVFLSPAARAWRDTLVSRLREAIDEVKPDALHLAHSGLAWNDGAGLHGRQTFIQGMITLHRTLLTAFPELTLSGDGMNEQISPFCAFTQRDGAGSLPAHPISTFLFGDHVLPYAAISVPSPSAAPFAHLARFARLIKTGVPPSAALPINEMHAGWMALAERWHRADYQPDWQSVLAPDTLFRWRGTGSQTIQLERTGPVSALRTADETVLQWASGVNVLASGLSIPCWPARGAAGILGMDPAHAYGIGAGKPPIGPRLTALSPGVVLEGSQPGRGYSLFLLRRIRPDDHSGASVALEAPESHAAAWSGSGVAASASGKTLSWSGLRMPDSLIAFYDPAPAAPGRDLSSGSLLDSQAEASVISDGFCVSRSDPAILALSAAKCGDATRARSVEVATPEWGERALTWAVRIPESGAKLLFAAGLPLPNSRVRFSVRIDGRERWKWESDRSQWMDAEVDLSDHMGRPALIQLVVESPDGDGGISARWADVSLRPLK